MKERGALIVVTHLLGVGHLVRAAALGRALAAAGWRVTIVSGGKPAANVNFDGCEIVQAPPLQSAGADFGLLLKPDGAPADEDWLAARRETLIAAFDSCAPDALITELFPFGRRRLAAEFEALLAHARAAAKRPAILCSIRDILQPPSSGKKALEAHARLGRFYDAILFHGEEAIIPLDASWPVDPPLRRRLRATGYVRDAERSQEAAVAADEENGEILVSGGGSSAGLALARIAIAAARLCPEKRWRALVGHGVSEADFIALRESAPGNARVERARPDFPALLARAGLSISQAGDNTMLDLAAAGARALLVPFAEAGEREQSLRAERFAARGLARALDTAELSPERLAAEAAASYAAPKPDWSGVALDGAARAAAIIADEADKARDARRAWRALDNALADLRAAGKTARLWLRDDDAVEMTGALRDYLAMLRRHRAPVALAVIPSRLSDDLAPSLRDEKGLRLLIHGWSHENHAPAPQKKCEFPPERPIAAMREDAARALAAVRARAPSLALPVFVPPWNRMDETLRGELADRGYAGLSMFADRRAIAAAGTLRRRDAHWDPIAWRAGGGLLPEAALLDRMTTLLREELDGAGGIEPLGMLTHHLVHDGWTARFLDELIGTLGESGVARFLAADEVFGLQPGCF